MTGEPILIVDDNLINLKLAKILLSIEGYEIRTATDAKEALNILETFKPKLILMDIQLPEIDGLELTRQLKADQRYKNIIILALTAYAMKGDKEKALQAGCDGYIAKPIDTEAMPKMIADFLKNASSQSK